MSSLSKLVQKVKKWTKENRREAVLLTIILLVGAFLRLYRISEYMTFLGDEGRDVIIVRRLLVNFDPILVGPGTSIGNMYLGPIYYYMMAPALLLANFSPVGPAVMIALLGIATVFFIWYVTWQWFPSKDKRFNINMGALVAAGLYAIAPVMIIYSRSSWNPNIMPFFALLSVYSIWKVWSENKFGWLLVASLSIAFALQSHYLSLLLLPILGLFWLVTFWRIKDKNTIKKVFVRLTSFAVLIFVLLMSPLFIFDARHGWRNFSAIKKFFLERQTTVSARPWTAIPKIPELWEQLMTRLVAGTNETLGIVLSAILAAGVLWVLIMMYKTVTKKSKLNYFRSFLLITAWLAVALIGFGVYKQHIYDHYFGFVFAAPFIFIGGILQLLRASRTAWSKYLYYISLILILITVLINLENNPLRYPPNRQLQRSVEVARKIEQEAGGKKFNIAVIAERNYEGAYQYFLEMWDASIVAIDPQRASDTITGQLFVICELPADKCDPVYNPKAEIANFGWSKVESKWQVAGITLYKLVPNEDGL